MLIAQASKEQIAECARLLALNLAHYQSKFGELPLEETLAMIDTGVPNDDQAILPLTAWRTWLVLWGQFAVGWERRNISARFIYFLLPNTHENRTHYFWRANWL